jgi:Uma2 family endonuclease
MAALPVVRFFTHPEFVGFENASSSRHDLVDGQIVARGAVSLRHVAITTGARNALDAALSGGDCHAHGSDVRVYVPATGLSAYPDVTVICGKWQPDEEDPDAVVNPTVIVEVLSPSTERYDRVVKGPQYREIPSLRDLLLVAQDAERVQHWQRGADGEWTMREVVGPDGVIALASGAPVAIAAIYARLADLPVTS